MDYMHSVENISIINWVPAGRGSPVEKRWSGVHLHRMSKTPSIAGTERVRLYKKNNSKDEQNVYDVKHELCITTLS